MHQDVENPPRISSVMSNCRFSASFLFKKLIPQLTKCIPKRFMESFQLWEVPFIPTLCSTLCRNMARWWHQFLVATYFVANVNISTRSVSQGRRVAPSAGRLQHRRPRDCSWIEGIFHLASSNLVKVFMLGEEGGKSSPWILMKTMIFGNRM